MRRKPKCGRQTDGQTDMVIPVYPPPLTSLRGYKKEVLRDNRNSKSGNILGMTGLNTVALFSDVPFLR